MITTESFTINKDEEIIKFLTNSISSDNKVAIVGGHYMLFYDKQNDELVPLIKQDLENENQRKFAEMFTGNFPERSLEVSADILTELKSNNIESKLVFIVNDHKFQSKNFQPNILEFIKGRTGELRKKYYKKNILPKFFQSVFTENNLSVNDIQLHEYNETSNNLKNLESNMFYSEQRLRNKFDRRLKDKLWSEGKIKKVENSLAIEIYYEGFSNKSICLTENGGCGCSGEVIEFLYELSALGYTQVIFFVPSECAEAANNGFAIVTDTIKVPISIYSIYGAGGMGVKDITQFQINKFSNE